MTSTQPPTLTPITEQSLRQNHHESNPQDAATSTTSSNRSHNSYGPTASQQQQQQQQILSRDGSNASALSSTSASASASASASSQTMSIMLSSLSFEPLLNRESTFWPTQVAPRFNSILRKHPSFEFLNPPSNSILRQSSPMSSIFNLVATVCGGGVLTLPIAFARVGVLPSTVLMVFSALITDFAMYILCSCARRTGGKSYGDVTRIAFGRKAEIGVTILLVVFLVFVIVAYMVLVKDIWTPLILYLLPTLKEWCEEQWGPSSSNSFDANSFTDTSINMNTNINTNTNTGGGEQYEDDDPTLTIASNVFLLGFIVLSLPLLLKRNLHALRHTCYVGFVSLILLIIAIVRRSYQVNCVDVHLNVNVYESTSTSRANGSADVNVNLNADDHPYEYFQNKIKWYSNDINDVIYAFPIIALSFFSIYNVLSVHSSLINPTRERVKFVLDGTIAICLVLFYIVGLCGYLYAYEETKDNILLNLPMDYKIVLIGRLGYGFTLMFGLPLVFLPCREALLSIPVLIGKWIREGENIGDADIMGVSQSQARMRSTGLSHKGVRMSGITKEGHVVINGIDFDEERPLLKRNSSIIPMTKAVKMGNVIPMQHLILSPSPSVLDSSPGDSMHQHFYGSTTCVSTSEHTIHEDNSGEQTAAIQNSADNSTDIEQHKRNRVDDSALVNTVLRCNSIPSRLKVESSMSTTDGISLHKMPRSDGSCEEQPCESFVARKDSIVSTNSMPASIIKKPSDLNANHANAETSSVVHFLSTVCILAFGYICSVAVPGVGLVWSICGSSMSLIIGFFIPAACYLKIRSRKKLNPRSIAAWTMVLFSITASVICTSHVIKDANL